MEFVNEREFKQQGQLNAVDYESIGYQSAGDTYSSALKNTLAAENFNSERRYYDKSVNEQLDNFIKQAPENKALSHYKKIYDTNDNKYLEDLIDSGKFVMNEATGKYEGTTNHTKWLANSTYRGSLDAITAYRKAIIDFQGKDASELKQQSKQRAYEDWQVTQKRLSNTSGLVKTLAEFGGSMTGALDDPVTQATLLVGAPVKMVGTGAKALLGAAGRAAVQEAKIGLATEIPIQMAVYDWKNEIGIDYSIKDAIINASASIAGASILRAGGSITVDVTSQTIAKFKSKAIEDKNEADVILAEQYEKMVKDKLVENVDDHIDTLNEVRRQIENGEDPKIDDFIDSTTEHTQVREKLKQMEEEGRAYLDKNKFDKPTLKDAIVNNPLNDINQKPVQLQRTGTDDMTIPTTKKDGKGTTTEIPETKIEPQDHMKLEDLRIQKEGQSDYVDAKYQEMDEFLKTIDDDMTIPVQKLDEDGKIVYEEKSLREELGIISRDESAIKEVLECYV